MDKIQSLYDLYLSKGLITEKTSIETFSSASQDQINKLYELGAQNGLFSKVDAETFATAWGEKKKDGSESPSVDGSSEFVQVDNEALASANKAVLNSVGVPNIFGDFLSNAITRGLSAGSAADETFKLMSSGKELSDEDIQEYIKVNKLSEAMGQSDEMKAFNEKYDEDVKNGDSGIWAFMKGIYENPKVAGEVAITSMAQMAASGFASGETAAMVAAGSGAGAAIGAAAGAIGGPLAPVSSTIGAIGGTIKGAMSAAGGITEVAASFTEFLRSELDGKEFTQENIRKVLANEEAKQRIINKSLARGATVAAIDFLAAGAAGKAVSSIKSVGRTGKAIKGVTATGIESVGGATGETAARLVTGQELDTKEILFEAVGEAPGAVVSGPIGMLSAPKYSINNSRLTKKDFLKVLETSTDQELLDMNIKIDNDEGMSDVFNERIKKANIKKDIDPTITDEKDIDTVVDLELKIKDLKNRKTSSAKNKVKQLEQQIKDIQSKYDSVDSETTEATTTEEAITEDKEPFVTEKKKEKVSDVIGRPITLTYLGGSKLETPIDGEVYVEGQQVVIEDADGNITEIGNVDEVSDSALEDIGIETKESDVKTLSDGNLEFEGTTLVPNKKGIKRNKRGEINRVVLTNEKGDITKTLRGANAEEAAYQILLKEATSPEQAQFINEQLENDAEFQNEFTETTEPTQAETTEVPQQDTTVEPVAEPTAEPTRKIDFTTVKDKALQALSSVIPNVEVVVHDTEESYSQAVGNKDSRGAFLPETNTIHINSSTANEQTIAHESFHALMLNILKSDREVAKRVKSLLKAVESKAPAELKAYLKTFAASYDANIQSEEKLAEMFGVLASGFPKLDAPAKLTVRNLLQYIQTKLGLKEFTDREAVEFMNTISNKVRTGEKILSEDIAILERTSTIGGKMSNRFQANFKDVASGLEFVYDKNNEKFADLEAKGFITKDRSSTDFDGNYVFLHQPDAAFSGEILKDGETIVEGKGGMYYPIKFHDKGYFWASTASAAEKMASDLNKVHDQNNGKILMALTSAPSDKLLSSTTMSNAVLDFFTSKAIDRKFKLKKNDFQKAIVKAANQTMTVKKANGGTKVVGLDLKARVSRDIKETLSDIKTKLGAENSSFADRKLFAQSLISNIADVIKQDAKATDQFADLFSVGIQNQYFKGISKTGKKSISKANIIQAMSEMFTEPILKEGVDRNRGGQVYAILELDSKVEPVDATEHESYPKAIKAVDGDVKLHILKDRFNWSEMFEDPQTNQIVDKSREQNIYPSSSGVSTQGLKLNASNIKSKLQSSGIEFDAVRMIKRGIKLGISDTSILESLKDMGYNPDSSYDLLQNYKEEFRKEGESKEGVYVGGNNKLKNGIEKAYRMALSPRGFLPKSMMIAKEVLQGMIDSEVKIARNNIRLLERKLERYNDQELKEIVGKIDAYIRGDISVELPSDLIDIASDMRNHVDDLSSKLIESGAVDSKESIENIRGNIGSYLNRSYKLFDKDNYVESIPQSVIDKAKARLKKDYRKLAEEESKKTGVDVNTILNNKVDAAIQNILKKDEANSFISAAKTGSKNLKSLKRKKDIPAEIRALMGEYGDPAFNYIQSVNKIESMVANQIFLNKMRKKGEGVFFFKERTGNATELIAPEGSDQYNPLNGYYTTPEIKKALEGQTGFKFTGSLEVLQKPYEGYLKGVGFVKKMKTIYSVGTQAKNIIGIVPVLISNGYVTDFQSFKTAFKALNNDLRRKNDAELNAKMDEYLKSGIIGSSVVVSEIKSMMDKGETFEDAMIKRLAETDENKLSYYAQHAWGNAKKIDKALITAYQTTDDFSKILGYEVEKKRYAKAKFGKEYNKLDSSQQEEVNDIAAEIVKNNIPNYGRVGGLVKALKALPIAGTFISFHAEAIRTAYNTVDQAMKEMQDPQTKDIGVERMKGILAVSATATLLPTLFGLSSIGNPEEEEEENSMKYARMFMPDWDKNSSVVIYDQPKDGKFSYISLSASDPYGALSQAVNAAMSGENMADSAVRALGELVSPFFEKDMILESIGKIGDVIKDGVNKKYNVSDTSLRFMAELGKLIAPGTYTSAMKIDDAYFKKDESAVKEAIGQMTGFKPRKIDIPKQAMFMSYKIKGSAAENKKTYSKIKREFIQRKEGVTREDVKAEYIKINAAQKEIYGELIDMYKGAIYLGAPKVEVLKSMKAAGIPMYIIKGIAKGKIPDMNI